MSHVPEARSGEELWLAKLIQVMEEMARTEGSAAACDTALLTAVKAHLAQPAPLKAVRAPFPVGRTANQKR